MAELSMTGMRVFTLLLVLGVLSQVKGTSTIRYSSYGVCPKGVISAAQQQTQYTVSSTLQCLARCSETPDCSGVNVCPGELSGQVRCTMTGEVLPGSCEGLTSATSPLCFHVQSKKETSKVTRSGETHAMTQEEMTTTTIIGTTELECQNNGTLNGNTCNCSAEYRGKACQHRIRDCSDAYDNGLRKHGIFLIQPATAPSPFWVHCKFQWGGVTWAFQRYANSDVSQDWVTYKQGFGHPSAGVFFVGLDNLHHLTNQASYEFQVWIEAYGVQGGGSMYYNLTIGPESTSYVIAFDSLNPDNIMDNCFATSPPVKFSSSGHDTNNCYSQKGKAGWYGRNCTGYGMLSNGNFYWSQSGSEISVHAMYFMLVRQSQYYN